MRNITHQSSATWSFELPRGTSNGDTRFTAINGVSGECDHDYLNGTASHLSDGHFLTALADDEFSPMAEILAALPGNANGDRVVDGQHFFLWNSHKFESGTFWLEGVLTWMA